MQNVLEQFEFFLKKQLNDAQFEAVSAAEGPVLILAGAGSGKTRVLTYRLAYLIHSGKARPHEVLAVTFTNKAAKEMLKRCLELLGYDAYDRSHQLWISTFHSSCVRILRSHSHELGYSSQFVIYDPSDQLSVVKKILERLSINDKLYPAKNFLSRINDAKMLGLLPKQYERNAKHAMEERTAKVYELYEQEMKNANAVDFGDLLLKTLILFQTHPDILSKYQNQFKYVLVDEYQDTNSVQYLLVKALVENHRNLCVVGDEDQSIYSWRGADIRNILDFEKDFSEAKIIKLEENYRSTKNIVEAASQLISNNSQRKDKNLFTQNSSGELIHVQEENNEYSEGRFVAQQMETLMKSGEFAYSDFAIFYRTNAQSRVLEEQLRSHGLPYRVYGGVRFYDRMEVKDILGYMKVLFNPLDDVAVSRIINVPARGIGKTTLGKLTDIGQQQTCHLLKAIEQAVQNSVFNKGTTKKLNDFLLLLEHLKKANASKSLSEIYHEILDQTGYVQNLKSEDSAEATSRIENLEELNNAIVQFENERGDEASLQTFLEELALISDVDSAQSNDPNSVTLMTLHTSKGLEFPFVFIVGMEDGLFPSAMSFDSLDPTRLEEERRLAYVGMTRARKKLFLTYARNRKVWGAEQHNPPSRFLVEIPPQYTNKKTAIVQPSAHEKTWKPADVGTSSSWRDLIKSEPMPSYEDMADTFSDEPATSFKKGCRVRHPTFGVGTVYLIEGEGESQKVGVYFSNQAYKKFMVKFARLEILRDS